MTAYLAPQFDTQFFDGSTVAAGYKLYTYDSGTTTPKAVYSDQAGTVPHTNPIVLDANGRVTGQMWLGSGEYTFTLKTDADVLVKTWNDVAGSGTANEAAANDAAIRADLASTSSDSKGAGQVGQSASRAYSTGTVGEKLNRAKSVQDYPWLVVGNGVADDSTKLASALAAGVTDLYIDCPVYLNGTVTAPSTVGLHFGDRGYLIIGVSASVTINGPIYSNHNPFKYAAGVGSLTVSAQNLAVPGTYSTIQKAVDAVPGMIWQDWIVSAAVGTYNEDVRIESKLGGMFKPGSVFTAGSRSQLTITGATSTARDSTVRVKSFMVMDCHGGAYHPAIANLTTYGYNAYTNEQEAISFYGCSGGAVAKVSFNGTGAAKCIMSFGSHISVEGVHFGSNVNDYGLVTKHGGQIYCPDANALNGELDIEGTVKQSVCWPISGFINAANLSKVIGNGFNEWDNTGLRSGAIFTGLDRALSGPSWFHEYLSSWQSYFSSASEFETFLDAGTTLAYVSSEGINLQTVNAKNVSLWIRRNRSIQINDRLIKPMQMVVSCYFASVTGDAIIKIGNKGSSSEDGVYFKLTSAGLYGGYQAGASAEVLTSQICTYAQAVGKNVVLWIRVNNDGSAVFKMMDTSYNTYKQALASGTVSGSSTYAFQSGASSASVGAANYTLSEARVARY